MSVAHPKLFEYVIEDGLYALYRDGERQFVTEEVSILFDKRHNVLHKHGLPSMVDEAFSIFRGAHVEQGALDMAEDLVVIQGKFDIEDLNNVLGTCDYIGKLYAKLQQRAGSVSVQGTVGAEGSAAARPAMT